MYRNFFKRVLDIVISFLGIIIFLFPMLLIALAIKIDDGGPVLFKQVRLGKEQKCFTIYKFRTMISNAYEFGGTSTFNGDPRITKVGSFLRKTSLDEIPQFFNIFKGDMSIIGPRPILKKEFDEYKNNILYSQRYLVLPGLFCSVDLAYRAQASRELQFEMDADYSNYLSFWTDFKLFFGIIKTVLLQKNVYKSEVASEDSIKDTYC